jgi:undecaprenyl diphosphate synthase
VNEINAQVINLKHVAIIMDGNARWANDHGLPKSEGHKKGAENVKKMIEAAIDLKIPYFTLYAFSSENWNRNNDEVSGLVKLLNHYLQQELDVLDKYGIKFKLIGKLNRLSKLVQKRINNTVESTKYNNKMTLCLAFSYGGRAEIVDACQKLIDSDIIHVTEDDFRNYLYDPEMPDVDLLIRPSGVYRISNFLLWQSAYAELYFCRKYWPDFKKEDLIDAIKDYATRKRTFGCR